MRVGHFVAGAILLGTGLPALLHLQVVGRLSLLQSSLSFFCFLNLMISLWEVALGLHIDAIRKEFIDLKERFKGNEGGAVVEFFLQPIQIKEAFSWRLW